MRIILYFLLVTFIIAKPDKENKNPKPNKDSDPFESQSPPTFESPLLSVYEVQIPRNSNIDLPSVNKGYKN